MKELSPEKRWLLLAFGALVLLSVLLLLPTRKEDQTRLWSKEWNAIEYQSPKGTVRIERSAGWFSDIFLIQIPGRASRLAGPGVKGFFTDLQSPVVKGEYLLSEKEAEEFFTNPRCMTLIEGKERREMCAGKVSGGQAFVRLKEEPRRAYLMPEYIFNRIQADPETYIDKRLVVLPSGGVPRRIFVRIQDQSIELIRKKEKVEGGDKVHWFLGEKEVSLNLVNNLLSATYELQRERMIEEVPPQSAGQAEIILDVAAESPAVQGIFKGAFGGGRIHVQLYGPRIIDKNSFYQVTNGIDASADLVNQSRVDRIAQAMEQVKQAPDVSSRPPQPMPPAQPGTSEPRVAR